MQKEKIEHASVNFSLPETPADPVMCRRMLPNGRAEIIGRIYQDFGSGDGLVTYTAVSKDGEELCPLTEDFSEVENAFQKYSLKLSMEEREKKWLELADRHEEVERIRQGKRKHNEKEISR